MNSKKILVFGGTGSLGYEIKQRDTLKMEIHYMFIREMNANIGI